MIKKISILVFVLLSACKSDPEQGLFTAIPSSQTQINFENKLQDTKALNALDYMYFYDGGGVAVGDINNDGLPDIYFTANKGPNKLYLNKGNFKFQDITETAGVAGHSDWNTGVVMADVNGDGLLDIYVCAVSGILGFKGHNELFINNGDLTFTEESAKYHLDIQSQANNAAFFDYDKDGDLDMYLVNEGKHSAESFGPASNRTKISEANGGRLLRNDNGVFVNVSQSAGIYSGPNSYGLGVAVADFNQDGWDDLYISNDFHEDDYYYINNKNGTFTEQLKSHFGKVSRFSMGDDVADINHDGYPDIVTLDMMPEEEKYLKSTLTDNDVQYHKIRENLGYYQQFSRNMLQINQKGKYFTDVALYSGVAATDWSWAPLLADYDQDGQNDLFITNGIYKRLNDLDYLKVVTGLSFSKKMNSSRLYDNKALDLMPRAAVHNYIYKGEADLKFKDKSGIWMDNNPTESSGAAFADLDNDGDLDLIINNYNGKPSILRNNSKGNTFLELQFKSKTKNTAALGTKVLVYNNNKLQYSQLYTTRGFQSSVEPMVHFGCGQAKQLDSVIIIWPDNTRQTLKQVKTNQRLEISPIANRTAVDYNTLFPTVKPWFRQVTDSGFVNIKHTENYFSEFTTQPFIPYEVSAEGPAFAVAELKNNANPTVFVGGSKRLPAHLYSYQNDAYKKVFNPDIEKDSITEDVDAQFFDADGDGDLDLMVVSGGDEFSHQSIALLDRLYLNNGKGVFSKSKDALPDYFENGSIVRISDVDHDGDMDMFVGGRVVPKQFGKCPKSYLLLNDGKGKFKIAKSILSDSIGMVTDAVFTDFNNDGYDDLIVVGEWMAPQFFENVKGTFKNVTKQMADVNNTGLWQAIIPFDIDGDGDTDYLLGNWGLNSKFKASTEEPLKMYAGDYNQDHRWESLLCFAKNDNYYSVNEKDELDKYLPKMMHNKFKSYKDFAGKSFYQIFDQSVLDKGILKTVTNLSSGYLENNNGHFTFKPFNPVLQLAPITCFAKSDFNKDGKDEVLMAGNLLALPPYNGTLDGNVGYILEQGGKVISGIDLGLDFGNKAVKHLKVVTINHKKYVWAAVNGGKMMVYQILN